MIRIATNVVSSITPFDACGATLTQTTNTDDYAASTDTSEYHSESDGQVRSRMALDQVAPLSAAQVRAARGMLDWTARELADHSGVSFSTVRRIEAPGRRLTRDESLRAVRTAFERHGVEFVVLEDGRRGLVSKR